MLLRVGEIGREIPDYERLAQFCAFLRAARTRGTSFTIDFDADSISPVGIAALGAIALEGRLSDVKFEFNWASCQSGLLTSLREHGFCHHFGGPASIARGNAVPFRIDRKYDWQGIVRYLTSEWFREEWPISLSQRLRVGVIEKVIEIYDNSFSHSSSPMGTVSCGQFFPDSGELELCVVDLGVGIDSNVRQYLRNPNMDSVSTLEWAFETGNSTKNQAGAMRRGVGLDLLQEFARANKGRLEIYSGSATAQIHSDAGELVREFMVLRYPFPGTAVTFTVKCDNKYYRYASEAELSV